MAGRSPTTACRRDESRARIRPLLRRCPDGSRRPRRAGRRRRGSAPLRADAPPPVVDPRRRGRAPRLGRARGGARPRHRHRGRGRAGDRCRPPPGDRAAGRADVRDRRARRRPPPAAARPQEPREHRPLAADRAADRAGRRGGRGDGRGRLGPGGPARLDPRRRRRPRRVRRVPPPRRRRPRALRGDPRGARPPRIHVDEPPRRDRARRRHAPHHRPLPGDRRRHRVRPLDPADDRGIRHRCLRAGARGERRGRVRAPARPVRPRARRRTADPDGGCAPHRDGVPLDAAHGDPRVAGPHGLGVVGLGRRFVEPDAIALVLVHIVLAGLVFVAVRWRMERRQPELRAPRGARVQETDLR